MLGRERTRHNCMFEVYMEAIVKINRGVRTWNWGDQTGAHFDLEVSHDLPSHFGRERGMGRDIEEIERPGHTH